MSTASLCKKYVMMKHSQDIDEYISERKISMLIVWGSDVELFCPSVWLEVDNYVLFDQTWQKLSFIGFNPKRGRKVSSPNSIYLENHLIIMNL